MEDLLRLSDGNIEAKVKLFRSLLLESGAENSRKLKEKHRRKRSASKKHKHKQEKLKALRRMPESVEKARLKFKAKEKKKGNKHHKIILNSTSQANGNSAFDIPDGKKMREMNGKITTNALHTLQNDKKRPHESGSETSVLSDHVENFEENTSSSDSDDADEILDKKWAQKHLMKKHFKALHKFETKKRKKVKEKKNKRSKHKRLKALLKELQETALLSSSDEEQSSVSEESSNSSDDSYPDKLKAKRIKRKETNKNELTNGHDSKHRIREQEKLSNKKKKRSSQTIDHALLAQYLFEQSDAKRRSNKASKRRSSFDLKGTAEQDLLLRFIQAQNMGQNALNDFQVEPNTISNEKIAVKEVVNDRLKCGEDTKVKTSLGIVEEVISLNGNATTKVVDDDINVEGTIESFKDVSVLKQQTAVPVKESKNVADLYPSNDVRKVIMDVDDNTDTNLHRDETNEKCSELKDVDTNIPQLKAKHVEQPQIIPMAEKQSSLQIESGAKFDKPTRQYRVRPAILTEEIVDAEPSENLVIQPTPQVKDGHASSRHHKREKQRENSKSSGHRKASKAEKSRKRKVKDKSEPAGDFIEKSLIKSKVQCDEIETPDIVSKEKKLEEKKSASPIKNSNYSEDNYSEGQRAGAFEKTMRLDTPYLTSVVADVIETRATSDSLYEKDDDAAAADEPPESVDSLTAMIEFQRRLTDPPPVKGAKRRAGAKSHPPTPGRAEVKEQILKHLGVLGGSGAQRSAALERELERLKRVEEISAKRDREIAERERRQSRERRHAEQRRRRRTPSRGAPRRRRRSRGRGRSRSSTSSSASSSASGTASSAARSSSSRSSSSDFKEGGDVARPLTSPPPSSPPQHQIDVISASHPEGFEKGMIDKNYQRESANEIVKSSGKKVMNSGKDIVDELYYEEESLDQSMELQAELIIANGDSKIKDERPGSRNSPVIGKRSEPRDTCGINKQIELPRAISPHKSRDLPRIAERTGSRDSSRISEQRKSRESGRIIEGQESRGTHRIIAQESGYSFSIIGQTELRDTSKTSEQPKSHDHLEIKHLESRDYMIRKRAEPRGTPKIDNSSVIIKQHESREVSEGNGEKVERESRNDEMSIIEDGDEKGERSRSRDRLDVGEQDGEVEMIEEVDLSIDNETALIETNDNNVVSFHFKPLILAKTSPKTNAQNAVVNGLSTYKPTTKMPERDRVFLDTSSSSSDQDSDSALAEEAKTPFRGKRRSIEKKGIKTKVHSKSGTKEDNKSESHYKKNAHMYNSDSNCSLAHEALEALDNVGKGKALPQSYTLKSSSRSRSRSRSSSKKHSSHGGRRGRSSSRSKSRSYYSSSSTSSSYSSRSSKSRSRSRSCSSQCSSCSCGRSHANRSSYSSTSSYTSRSYSRSRSYKKRHYSSSRSRSKSYSSRSESGSRSPSYAAIGRRITRARSRSS